MSTPSQPPADAAAAVVAQQAQESSLNDVATKSPTSSSPSSSVFPFLTLPAELIKSVLEQCDNSTILKLRAVARKVKTIIDEDFNLDQFPFRYRPLINPPLTEVQFLDIVERKRALDIVERKRIQTWETGKPLFKRPGFHNFITVNPALDRLHWSAKDGWTEARLGSRLRDGDDLQSVQESFAWSDEEGEYLRTCVSRFKVKDFPWVLDETATRPPVSSLKVVIKCLKWSEPFVWTVVGQKEDREERRVTTSAPAAGTDIQHEPPQPVLVRDVIRALVVLVRNCNYIWPCDDPYRGAQDDRVPLLPNGQPELGDTPDNMFSLTFHNSYD
ncbi:hypothetical protein A4X13_0g2367 [Tilletia indica]|uniref:Uncharacterized protein n=1 Tax=Tilletia indica TaxID=43049 RepID=A0A177TKI4_9BASI|nr:hypothetical protein A4X13_0g2367 [Tilletia indica]